ncbi:MAG: ribosome-associated translation inhibitor RaiA [Prevotellaceae bacterium]|nr:ribosome-associated translation inhibitor RaiA [Prevotellaceae bacterium]
MEIKIQAVNFDAQEKLQEFVNKKVEKLSKSYDDIQKVEVQLKVVKPATALNKHVSMNVGIPGAPVFVEKTCDTFEEGVDLCVDALKVKLAKIKEKARNH